jgi:NADH:ubiquinone oxidoreductase subunit 3 (subunit A)
MAFDPENLPDDVLEFLRERHVGTLTTLDGRGRFHLVAIAFLVFDVELLFLYPWAVANKAPQHIRQFSTGLVFAEVMVFVVLLTAGFVYAWRKGVFRWR